MPKSEFEQFLERGVDEVSRLRQSNEIMSAKLEVYETFSLLVRGLSRQGYGASSDDFLWTMKKRLEELRQEAKLNKAAD